MDKYIKKLIIIIVVAILLVSSIVIIFGDTAKADTGTYTINKEYVDLTIQKDSNVLIKYNITMKVHSGNIPWVTVGLPNSRYNVETFGGSAKTCKSNNRGSWTGVRIDLDKTYYVGESFSFWFTALQKQFIYEYNETQVSIQFTPCWWDNAIIEDLKVVFHLPGEILKVTTTKEGAEFNRSTVTWQWDNVVKGKKYTVGFIMSNRPFTNYVEQVVSSEGDDGTVWLWLLLFMVTIAIIIFVVVVVLGSPKYDYEEPSMSVNAEKERIRHINMVCPDDGTLLDKRTIEGVTIDFCDKCGGIYFDEKEVEGFLRKEVDEKDINTNNIKDFTVTTTTPTICPRCDESLKKVTKTKDNESQTIYVCEECDGLWLKHGTYQVIKDKREEQISLQRNKLSVKKGDYYDDDWWYFHPYIYYPYWLFRPHYRSSSSSSSSSSSYSSHASCVCACVSCACVASCACACACAGGGAAGCSPKEKGQIDFGR